jgi:hypothetical protein
MVTDHISLHLDSSVDQSVILLLSDENGGDIILRQGLLAAGGIAFDAPITVGARTDSLAFRNGRLAIEDEKLWILADVFNGVRWFTERIKYDDIICPKKGGRF